MEKAIKAAIAKVQGQAAGSELEQGQLDLIEALLSDALGHAERMANVLSTAAKAKAIQDAQVALDAAQAAQ